MSDSRPLPDLPDVPLVSVYSTVYNHERFVASAIESVLSQEWPRDRLQYVVLDDGSSDRSAEIVERYADHLTFIRQENQGITAAVNRVLEPLTGDVIMSVSGDDMWPADRIVRQVEFMREHPAASMVYADLEVIDDQDRVIEPSWFQANRIVPVQGRITGSLMQGNTINGGPMAMRGCLKSLFWPVPDHACWEDWWMGYRLSLAGEVLCMPGVAYRYRVHGNNFSHGADERKQAELIIREIGFRLWMIANTPRDKVTIDELLAAKRAFEASLQTIESRLGRTPADVLPAISAQDRTRVSELLASARSALGIGAWDVAMLLALRAYSIDPLSNETSEALAAAQDLRASVAVLDESDVARDCRRFLVAGRLEELAADPSLLGAFCSAFDAASDATLAIHTSSAQTAAVKSVETMLERISRSPQVCPDLLLLTDRSEASWRRLSVEAHATLTRSARGGPRPALADDRALRELALRVWRGYRTEAEDRSGAMP